MASLFSDSGAPSKFSGGTGASAASGGATRRRGPNGVEHAPANHHSAAQPTAPACSNQQARNCPEQAAGPHARVDARQTFDPAEVDRQERSRLSRRAHDATSPVVQQQHRQGYLMRRAQSMTTVELDTRPHSSSSNCNNNNTAVAASASQQRIVASGSERNASTATRPSQSRRPTSPPLASAAGGHRMRSMSTARVKSRASLKSLSSVGSLSEMDANGTGMMSPKKTFGCDDFEHANGTEDFHVVSVEWVREPPRGRRAGKKRADWMQGMNAWRSRFGTGAAAQPAANAGNTTPSPSAQAHHPVPAPHQQATHSARSYTTSPASRIAASSSRKGL